MYKFVFKIQYIQLQVKKCCFRDNFGRFCLTVRKSTFFQPVSKLIHIKIICSKIRNTNSKSYLEVYFNIWFYRFIMYYVLTKVELISKTSTPDTNFPSFFPPTLEFWNLVFFLMIFVIEMSFDAMFSYANLNSKIQMLTRNQLNFCVSAGFEKSSTFQRTFHMKNSNQVMDFGQWQLCRMGLNHQVSKSDSFGKKKCCNLFDM